MEMTAELKEERVDNLTRMYFDADLEMGAVEEILQAQNMLLCNLFEEIGIGEVYLKVLTAQQLSESSIKKLENAREELGNLWQKSNETKMKQ